MTVVFTKLRALVAQFPYLPQALTLVWHAARWWTIAWVFLLFVQGLLPIASVYLTRTVVNSLVGSTNQLTPQAIKEMLFWVFLVVFVLVLAELMRGLLSWVRMAQAELAQDHISQLIHSQATTLDMTHYENADYYDRLHRARIDALNKPVALLENIGTLLQNGITFVAMIGILFTFEWWLPPLLILSALPALAVVIRYTVRENQWRLRNTEAQRRSRYYDWLLTDREAVAEIRILGLGSYFQAAFQAIRQRLRHERIGLAREQMMVQLTAGGIALMTMAGALAWMIWRVRQGTMNLGDLAMFYQIVNQAQRLICTLTGSAQSIYSNILFLENLFTFLALQPTLANPPDPKQLPPTLQEGILFETLHFTYPGSERLALTNFNLTIPAGKIVAIVGENGAGKSTLIKLLCRFYDPTAGRITLDGIDLRDLDQQTLRRRITVLFQQPVHYQATAVQNIALSDLQANATLEELESAAQAAGADAPINRLPQGFETMLGKWFGGAELSGGEYWSPTAQPS